jgi:hypothetical protein
MAATITNSHLAGLLERVEAQKGRARRIAGDLSDVQLRWVPPEGGWGVGMILEHLVLSAEMYYDIIPARIADARAKGLTAENPEWKRTFFGGFLIKGLKGLRKFKTTRRFIAQDIGQNVVHRFCEAQDTMMGFMRDADGIDLNRVKVKSPVLSLIGYNLADTFAVHTVHNDRHLNRAEEVTEMADFPAAATV